LDIFKLSNGLDIYISIYYLSYKKKIVNIFFQSLYTHTLNDKIINSIHICFYINFQIFIYYIVLKKSKRFINISI
jgi:hypothetical protein